MSDDNCVNCWIVRGAVGPEHALLSAEEQKAASTMRSPEARRRYVRSRAALRAILSYEFGIAPLRLRVVHEQGHAPRVLDAPALRISLSHAGDTVALAFRNDGPVGVDVEGDGIRSRPVPRSAVTVEKRAAVAPAVGSDVADLGVWVVQESVVKGAGSGLTVPLGDITLRRSPFGIEATVAHAGAWGVDLRRAGGDVVAVATPDQVPATWWHLMGDAHEAAVAYA